ncbi:MAG: chromosomal replication initiator protein DnaA [Anaerolineae bacterium]|jgi:chromosomal replication initiator protein|nr:chromosomal replication initiator protein DnaA [Chloroflexota bacterium]
MNAQELWQTACGLLQLQLSKPVYDTWFERTQGLSCEDGLLVVGVRSGYAKDWLENRLYGSIQRTLSEIAHRTMTVRFVVQGNLPAGGRETVAQGAELLEAWPLSQPEVPASATVREISQVNPRYTFDDFVVGQANRLAHAGGLAVAEKPGLAYNPLFIYGGAGLGKTHLLHAIGNRTLQDNLSTLYVSTEGFANELIQAIRNGQGEVFRNRYRSIEVLLLDDIQFLIGKEATQEEFFHTFNELYQRGRQIVLCSDRPPKAFVGLEERLRSRFEWGLVTDVQPPDLETRIAILSLKAEARGIQVAPELLEFIATQVQSNIRELEGALTRVIATARAMGEPLTIQTAQRALGEIAVPHRRLEAQEILEKVAEHFAVPMADLLGPRRSRQIALARQVGMYLVRDLTTLSLPQIGRAVGDRDHTTVLYAVEKVSALFEKDEALRREILNIKTALYGNAPQPVPAAHGVQHA